MKTFITGTDTGVGKTFFTSRLASALRRAGLDTVALKPVSCGDREDAAILRASCDSVLSLDDVNPIHLDAPLAPLVAARLVEKEIQPGDLMEWFERVSHGRRSVLVEGAGGWMVPLAPRFTMADLASQLGLPVLVVVANRLGCINHTVLTVAEIQSHGLICAGLALNHGFSQDESTLSNREVLEECTGVPVLFELMPDHESLEIRPDLIREWPVV